MLNLGIVLICYDGYGKYLPKFLETISKFENRPEITVVAVGDDHGAKDIEKVNIVYTPEVSMGEARNIGVENTDTDWILYFSIDDYLLPNCIEEIESKKDNDVVFLKFVELVDGVVKPYKIHLPTDKTIKKWVDYFRIPGYVAFKKTVFNKVRYIDSEFPNLPFIFQNYYYKAKFGKTEEVCAVYERHNDSHSEKIKNQGRVTEAEKLINSYIWTSSKKDI